MESHPSVIDRPVRIPRFVWFLSVGLIVALVAIFVFNAAVSTVVYYGFIALFVGSHFFMHGGHGGHGGSDGHQHGPVSNAVESDKSDSNEHSEHTGGCH
jgi:hypothetical protein